MRKIAIIISLVLVGQTFAQTDEDKGFSANKFLISAGYGTGNFLNVLLKEGVNYVKLESNFKSIKFVKAEYAVHENISVGLNFAHNGFDISYRLPDTIQSFTNKVPVEVALKYRSWSIMPRVNFHASPNHTVDVYGGFGIGYRHNNLVFTDNDPNKNWDLPLGFVPSLGLDATLGARAYITPNIAVYTELGIAKALLQGGLTVQF